MNRRKFIKTTGVIGIGTILLSSCKTIDNYIIKTITEHSKQKDKEEIEWIKSLSDYGYLSESNIVGKIEETEIPMKRQGYGVKTINEHYISMGHIYVPTIQHPFFGEQRIDLKERKTYVKGKELEEVIVKFEKDENGEWEDIAVFKVPKDLDIKEFPCPPSTEYKLGDRVALIGNPWLDGWNYRIGKITDVDGTSKSKNDFSTSILIAPGDSGCAYVNLENRTLIGVAAYKQDTLSYGKNMKSFMPYIEKDEDYFNDYKTGKLSFRRSPKTVYEKIKLPQEKDSLVLRP